jgi:crotonobetainyl-CoA:carnitine CoA-transferase CaiB-like acyl-CoA transferase
MTGFGPSGPRAGQPAYDPLLQAYSGIVSLTGQEGGAPSRVPVSLLDMGTAMWTVLGVFEGLRRRDATGEGCHIESSLLQTALTWMSVPLLTVMAGAPAPKRMGSGLAGVVPYGAYPASDGHVFISAGNDQAWQRLCEALDAPALQSAEGFGSNGDRVSNRALVDEALGLVTSRFETAEILRRLQAARVPCAPVQTVAQVVQDAQVDAIGAIGPLAHELVDDFRVVNLPVTFDGAYPEHRKAPPALGADTDEVLARLGRTAEEIGDLERDGVVQRRSPATVPSGEQA